MLLLVVLIFVCVLALELFAFPAVRHTHATPLPSLPSLLSSIDQLLSFILHLHHKQTSHWLPPLPPTTIHGTLPTRLCSYFTFGETFLPSALHKPSSSIAPLTPLCIIISVLPFFNRILFYSRLAPKEKRLLTQSIALSFSFVPADQHLQFPRK